MIDMAEEEFSQRRIGSSARGAEKKRVHRLRIFVATLIYTDYRGAR